ncbi:STAS domain-containing protein [Actinoplanes sp. NPDC049596]|uniref:STAS domain-containing protein n=1 Tax=unclassified Actinoplanes TaxID=2626549 RepID=UPI0034425115
MSLDYRIERDASTITVVPEGDISLETVDVLRQVLRSTVETPNTDRVDVDMSGVAFLDSSGIGVLVAAQRMAAARGVTLMLREPTAMVRMVLDIANLGDILVRQPATDQREPAAD